MPEIENREARAERRRPQGLPIQHGSAPHQHRLEVVGGELVHGHLHRQRHPLPPLALALHEPAQPRGHAPHPLARGHDGHGPDAPPWHAKRGERGGAREGHAGVRHGHAPPLGAELAHVALVVDAERGRRVRHGRVVEPLVRGHRRLELGRVVEDVPEEVERQGSSEAHQDGARQAPAHQRVPLQQRTWPLAAALLVSGAVAGGHRCENNYNGSNYIASYPIR